MNEPAFFYLPFQRTGARLGVDGAAPDPSVVAITHVTIGGPVPARSAAVQAAQATGWFATQSAAHHIMRLQRDGAGRGVAADLRPELPLVLEW